jgi:CheY-specific phosphatase CheX
MKRVELPYGIIVEFDLEGNGHIVDGIREDIDWIRDDPDEAQEKQDYNNMIDGVTSMVLGHACAGVDIESPAYIEGLETAIENIGNMA